MRRVPGFLFVAVICMFVWIGATEARVIKGSTASKFQNLKVSAVATDGSAVTVPVTVVGQRNTPRGVVYLGKYSLQVPEGQEVTIVFYNVKPDGTLKARTVAGFPESSSLLAQSAQPSSPLSTQLKVTGPLAGAAAAIGLGKIRVGAKVANPTSNPLDQVDTDGDGISDLEDADDDDDGIDDGDDLDHDGDGVLDDEQDLDGDDDGLPDVVDPDDDNDGIPDNVDTDDDNDGVDDWDGDTDSDDDGIDDADDPDDDNDGVNDDADDDQDGDGTVDDDEQDTDEDGVPDDIDDDDDNDGTEDSEDDDNDDDGVNDDDESDEDGDGVPDDSDED